MSKPVKVPPQSKATLQRYFGVVRVELKPGEYHQGYQIEIVELSGNTVVSKYRYDKVDTKNVTMAKLELMNDPDSQEYEEFTKKHVFAG